MEGFSLRLVAQMVSTYFAERASNGAPMPIFDTFHERQARLRADGTDVYVYDKLPNSTRVQIVQIMEDVLGDPSAYYDQYGVGPNVQAAYRGMTDILRKSIGVFRLPPTRAHDDEDHREEVRNFILTEPNVERALSAIELVCRCFEVFADQYDYRRQEKAEKIAKDGIADINARMKQAGVGYEYDGEIIRIDSELVHAEAVKPALALLRDPLYKTAEDEFLKAYEHYRTGDTKDALTNALKALESTMKIIGTKRGWTYDQKDTASKLIDMCYREKLIPDFWQTHFSGLRSVLEAGVPTARNRAGGHGGGAAPQQVPDHLAAYVLHLTASTIVFLVNAEKALP